MAGFRDYLADVKRRNGWLEDPGYEVKITSTELIKRLRRAYEAGARDGAEVIRQLEQVGKKVNQMGDFGDVFRDLFGGR